MALKIPFEVSVQELKEWLDAGKAITLIDVREPAERSIASIGGTLIPLYSLPAHLEEFDPNSDIVVYCRSGGRSERGIFAAESWPGAARSIQASGSINSVRLQF
ncbi:MAG: rhodanese-like domain-containing protein [Acidobacteriaceae bacterium]